MSKGTTFIIANNAEQAGVEADARGYNQEDTPRASYIGADGSNIHNSFLVKRPVRYLNISGRPLEGDVLMFIEFWQAEEVKP